jgi:hypothetical protein
VRDRINSGEAVGSRIFCAGNIIGNGGPWSEDFSAELGASVDEQTVERVNAVFEQGVGGDLLWLSAAEVRLAVREYIARSGIDFVKFASSAHKLSQFIAFSLDVQRAIVEEAHAAGLTAQACTQGIEALKMTIDAGADLLQHGDITGRRPMPAELLDTIVDRQIPCVAFLLSRRYISAQPPQVLTSPSWINRMVAKEQNDVALIGRRAKLLLAHDMCIYTPQTRQQFADRFAAPDQPRELGEGHIAWLRAAIERGMDPMDALLCATRNIAEAYQHYDQIGSIEPGKIADLVILDANPLAAPENYARVTHVIKNGTVVDRDRLPDPRLLTTAIERN